MAAIPCMCTSALCGHKPGEACGKPVKIALKTSFALDEFMTKFSPEVERGVCEECWTRITKQLSWLFKAK